MPEFGAGAWGKRGQAQILGCVCMSWGVCGQEIPFDGQDPGEVRRDGAGAIKLTAGASFPPLHFVTQACTHQLHLPLWHGHPGYGGFHIRDAGPNHQSPLLASGHLACGAALRGDG